MSPAKPAKKRAPKAPKAPKAQAVPKRTAVCRTCGGRIRIPEGWTIGPAVRRHYWAKHRDVMQPETPKRDAR